MRHSSILSAKTKKVTSAVLVATLIRNRQERIKPHTQQGDEILLKHLEAYGGDGLSITDIDSEFCKGFATFLIESRLKLSSVRLYLQKLHAVLQDAIYAEIITSNPMPPISRLVPKYISVERESLTVEEIERLLRAECRHLITRLAFLFSIFTGLRISDIETLRWDNIIHKDGGYLLKKIQVKTNNEVRIPLCSKALELLKQVQDQHLDKEGYIFPLFTRTTTAKDLNLWAKAAGIEKHVTFHVSRISFVTLSLSANVNIVVVSKLCGHKNIKTTQIYARIIDHTFEDAVKCLEQLFCHKEHYTNSLTKQWSRYNLLL